MSKPLLSACPLMGAAVLFVGAAWLWNVRQSEAAVPRQLLERTYQADNQLEYAALSDVSTIYGTSSMKSQARLVRAPEKMTITYLSGSMAGSQSGYNERWFWRRDKNSARPFAEVSERPAAMAKRRYLLLVKNYRATAGGAEAVNGRSAHIIELHPARTIDGAQGPYKRLWIDDETGLTLRTDAFNYELRPVMSSVLSHIDFSPKVSAETFMPPGEMQHMAQRTGWIAQDTGDDAAAAEKESGLTTPRCGWLPDGFELDGYGIHHCPAERAIPIVAALARYTDGLNTLTVFALTPQKNAAALLAQESAPKSCDFGPGTMVTQSRAGTKLVAVADLPPVTLTRVLEHTQLSASQEVTSRDATSAH